MSTMNVNTFAGRFLNGEFEDPSVKTQCDAGWYDWFCQDKSLRNKTRSLGKKVLQLLPSEKIDGNTQYVFFKNNCPVSGPLYDDFRICDMETGNVVYTITPKSGHTGQAEVWGRENDFDSPIVQGTWKDIKAYFGV